MRLSNVFFIIFFIWISFFPLPVHENYSLIVIIFFAASFLLIYAFRIDKYVLFSLRDWPLWLFLTCIIFGSIFALNKNLALLAYLKMALNLLVTFYIGKFVYSSIKQRSFVWMTISLCVLVVSVIGLFELYFGRNLIYEKFIFNPYYLKYSKNFPRPMSTQLNPAVLSSFILGCLPFSFVYCEKKYFGSKIFGFLTFLICLSIIILAASRGCFLGLIALVIFYLWKSNKKWLMALFLVCAFVFVVFSQASINKNIRQFGLDKIFYGGFDSVASDYRMDRVDMTAKMLKSHPAFGVGLNHFRLLFNNYSKYKDGSIVPFELMIPDNMYLSLAAETGTLGLAAFLIFIIFLINGSLKKLNILVNQEDRLAVLMPLSALIGLLIVMFGYDLFYWSNPLMLFSLICGFIAAA